MGELRFELRSVVDDELVRLLAFNREEQLSPAQLARLDFLLQQRGQAIDDHIAHGFATENHAA